jgi:ADP-heptose:LPS heptosyltransferase
MLRRNVLIFHAGALGDFVLSWPLALALGRLYPQSRVIYVAAGEKGALAERVLRVDWTDIESGWHGLFREEPTLPEPAAKLFAGAHTIVSFIGRDDDQWSRNVRRLAPETNLIPLAPRPPQEYTGHASSHLLEQLRPHPVVHATLAQLLRSVAERGISAARKPEAIVVHPGSGSPAKNWPRERFIELIERLKADGHSVRVTLGDAELERWGEDEIARFAKLADVRRPATYLDLLDELASARLFITNDSGPGHLAGIIGVPTICLFGPTDPNVWRPLGPRVVTLRAQPIESLPVETVLQQASAMTNV